MSSAPTIRGGERRLAALLLAPTAILLLIVLVLPTIFAFVYSLLDLRLATVAGFAGLENWQQAVFTSSTVPLLARTAVFVAGTVVLTVALALPIASLLDRLTRNRSLALQVVVIVPWVLSTVVASLLFRWTWLESLGIGSWLAEVLFSSRITPLLEPASAMVSLILVATWRTLGFAVLLLVAGLKSIDAEVFEAGKVDGASALQRFWLLTVPLLRTSLTIVVIVLLVSSLNNAEVPLVVTGGGPGDATMTLALQIYQTAFTDLEFGGAAALASAAMVINIFLVLAYTRLSRIGRPDL
ncbi:carbohydrate ABC transporter permease [Ruania zhangjianzhongii]|uniref:carbohydrate ABC transporter permease n=1 Tax=Ruania zhangjianzhongii TaxID=2603206 RepID=UPI0011CC9E2E|nr:sugar ABC transporter permease [Ruania zhangjianzhongii]